MNIFFDARALTNKRKSGIDEYVRLLTESLLNIDKKNHYIFFTNGFSKTKKTQFLKERENVSRVSWRIPNKIFDTISLLFSEPKVEKIVKRKIDIVFSPHFNLLNVSKKKTKRIIVFHDLSPIHFPELYPVRKQFWHWQQNIKEQVERTEKCVAVSDFTAQDLRKTFLLSDHKVQRIYSGINPFYKRLPVSDILNFRRSKNLQNPFLLFVGVLEPRKNITGIIKMFNILKKNPEYNNLKLIIAGKKGWLCDTIFREAGISVSKRDIIFWGEASFEELRFLYNSCEIFVYPSFFEGFGFPPLEAQSCGAPVVVSNRSSFPEIIGNSGMLADPWRIEEQVSAIETLMQNKKMKLEYIQRGYENIKRFSWEKTAEQFLKLFNDLAE